MKQLGKLLLISFACLFGCQPVSEDITFETHTSAIEPGDVCTVYECTAVGEAIAHSGEWRLGIVGLFCFPDLKIPPTKQNCIIDHKLCSPSIGCF